MKFLLAAVVLAVAGPVNPPSPRPPIAPVIVMPALELNPHAVYPAPVVLGDLHVGWRKSAHAEANHVLLDHYEQGAELDPIDAAVAAAYGDIRAELEASGTPIGANDLWIAAHARERHCVLVTHNVAEFSRVRGLRVEDWVAA